MRYQAALRPDQGEEETERAGASQCVFGGVVGLGVMEAAPRCASWMNSPCLVAEVGYGEGFMEDLDTASPTGFDRELPEETSGGSNKLVLIAIVLGVLGMVLGVTGVYMATQASNALKTYKAELATTPDPTAEALSAFQVEAKARIDDIDGRLGNIGGSIVRLQRQGASAEVAKQIQDMHAQTQSAFDSVSKEVKANRTQLNETNSRLEQLIALGGALPVARTAAASSSTASSTPAAEVVVPEGASVHTVQSGENPSVIARRYGLTLGALMGANPNLDPRRMMPGDKLIIPAAE